MVAKDFNTCKICLAQTVRLPGKHDLFLCDFSKKKIAPQLTSSAVPPPPPGDHQHTHPSKAMHLIKARDTRPRGVSLPLSFGLPELLATKMCFICVLFCILFEQ